MNRQDIDFVQSSISYQFKNLQLLEQAFTRKSYSEEHPEVLFETKLSAGAKLFYGEVLFLTYTYGFCSQKNAYFAANHRVSLRTVEN